MNVKVVHHTLTPEEAFEVRIKMALDLFDHLIESHGRTPREAAETVVRQAAQK